MFARWFLLLSRVFAVPAVLLAFLGLAASAQAGTVQELEQLPVLDALTRTESPLSGSGTWSPLSWAVNAGKDTSLGWVPATTFSSGANGAFWNATSFTGAGGVGAAVTMQAGPELEGRYQSIWIDMPNPSAAESGYQLRWTVNATGAYAVKLSKWSSGAETVLASSPSVSIPLGTRLELVDTGGTVEAWAVGASAVSLLSAQDAAYAGGYAGIEASGTNSRAVNFSAGPLVGRAVNATPVRDTFERQEVPLATGKWSKSNWTTGIGGAWCCGTYRGFGSEGALEGAYWNQGSFADAGGGVIVAATVGTGSPAAGEYQALWIDAPSPATATSGYEARFSGVNGSAGNYKVELSRWDSGTRTVLATKEAVSLAVGTTMAVTESAGKIVVWTAASGGESTPVVSAVDTAYRSGYAGIDVKGGSGTAYNFRAGEVGSEPPIVATGAASAIKTTGATLNGTVNPGGGSTSYQFEFGTTTSYGSLAPTSAAAAGSGSQNVAVNVPLTGLAAGTTYHYRLAATNGAGAAKGSDMTFTTVAAPVATTEAATEASATEATLNASVNPKGGATSYQFEYGKTTSYGSKVPATAKAAGSGSAAVAVSEKASGLAEGTLYHYRVVATNEAGTAYGGDQTVTTPNLPAAAAESTEAVNANEAILTGEVDPNGAETHYRFEYGPTTAYGSESAVGLEEAGGGQQPVVVSEPVSSLKPQTTYHYRVVATSPAGIVTSADKSFTTTASGISEAEEAKAEEEEEAGASSVHTPANFPGMMWSGNLTFMAKKGTMVSIKEAGAKWLRLQLHPSMESRWDQVRSVFREAAREGITVLPYFETGGAPDENDSTMKAFIKKSINEFGPSGSYWSDKPYAKEYHATWWEIGNEPNRGDTVGDRNGNGVVDPGDWAPNPSQFGRFFAHMAIAAREADSGVNLLFAGMYSTSQSQTQNCSQSSPCKMRIKEFINQADNGIAAVTSEEHKSGNYNAVSVHPYVFKVNENAIQPNDIKAVMKKVRGYVKEASLGAGGKPVWVTEFGYPTDYDGTKAHREAAPPVSEKLQGELIEAAFRKFKGLQGKFNVAHAFYYNIQDLEKASQADRVWSWACGLRTSKGKVKRAGWEAYARAAGGNPYWPKSAKLSKKSARDLKFNAGTLAMGLDNDGDGTLAHFQYWQPNSGSNPPVTTTGEFEVEGEQGEQDVSQRVTGLAPNTTYVFHPVVQTEEQIEAGTTTVGENEEFTTPPSTSTSAEIRRVLHGQPGYLWVNGWVKEGSIEGPGPGLANVHVHIKLFHNGVFERFVEATTNGEGHYESGYFSVGKGAWETKTEFPGGLEWLPSESGVHTFTVRDGVRIRAQHSGACWDIFGAQQNNGAAVMQNPCNEPVTSNEVFKLVPQGDGQFFEIVARNSGRCVDVDNASTADGSGLQQYDCLGAGQSNQLFREDWSGEWLSYVAKHSGKCVDVTGAAMGWTNLQQWTCNASPQQAFRLEPVESGPIGTETFLSVGPVLHGNGQYGNWGLATLSGHLLSGAYSMANRFVRIQVQKAVNGQWIQTDEFPLTVNPDGTYRINDYGLAPGIFRVHAVFAGDGQFASSESDWHQFAIWQANRLVARNSGKCMSLSNAAHENFNGQHLIQWDCSQSPSFSDGQTFWFWPVGNNVYEITVVGTGKCLDVALGSENGARLQQWDCTQGANQKFQVLELAGQPGWYAIRPMHQNRCLDVVGGTGATGNGAEIDQWDCTWASNQQWEIQGVIPG